MKSSSLHLKINFFIEYFDFKLFGLNELYINSKLEFFF